MQFFIPKIYLVVSNYFGFAEQIYIFCFVIYLFHDCSWSLSKMYRVCSHWITFFLGEKWLIKRQFNPI